MNELLKIAREISHIEGALKSPSYLRYQAVFLIGAPGSGKSFAEKKWLKYMPENPTSKKLTDPERSLSNIRFNKIVDNLEQQGIFVDVTEQESTKIPFVLYKNGTKIDPKDYASILPPDVLNQIKNVKEIIFSTPILELPTYWRQVDSDIYKKELIGYTDDDPGYFHYMSANMTRAYFEAILKTGDPFISNSSGRGMKEPVEKAKQAGYKISIVLVRTSLISAQIRNATRARKLDPSSLTKYWMSQNKYFANLKPLADKFHVIDSRDDAQDSKKYLENKDQIEFFMVKNGYASLRDLILKENSQELTGGWSKILM